MELGACSTESCRTKPSWRYDGKGNSYADRRFLLCDCDSSVCEARDTDKKQKDGTAHTVASYPGSLNGGASSNSTYLFLQEGCGGADPIGNGRLFWRRRGAVIAGLGRQKIRCLGKVCVWDVRWERRASGTEDGGREEVEDGRRK